MKETGGALSALKHKLSLFKKYLRFKGIAILVVIMMMLSPFISAAAYNRPASGNSEEGFLQSLGSALSPVQTHLAGDDLQMADDLREEEIVAALESLDEFNESVLKDEKLAAVLDDIIWEVLEAEELKEGFQRQQQGLADIISDPRLVNILGDVIADYLQDEQFADDIEYFFGVFLDLIADGELNFFIRDAIASLIEHPRLEDTIDELVTSLFEMSYQSGMDMFSDLLTDKRLGNALAEILDALTTDLPDVAVYMLEDKRTLDITEEILDIVMDYGTDVPVDLLEDKRFRSALADMIVVGVDSVPVSSISGDLSEYAVPRVGHGLVDDVYDLDYETDLHQIMEIGVGGGGVKEFDAWLPEVQISNRSTAEVRETVFFNGNPVDPGEYTVSRVYDAEDEKYIGQIAFNVAPPAGTVITAELSFYTTVDRDGHVLDKVLVSLVDNMFTDEEFQDYFYGGLSAVMEESSKRAKDATPICAFPGDEFVFAGIDSLRPMIAEAIAEVPPELARDGFFRWLVYGEFEEEYRVDPKPRSYRDWAMDMAELLSPERVDELNDALANLLRDEVDVFLKENKREIARAIGGPIKDPDPWNQVIRDIKANEKNIDREQEVIISRIIANLPLRDLAQHIRKELNGIGLDDLTGDLVDDIPFQRAANMLQEDRTVLNIIRQAVPDFSLREVANVIRHDQRLINALSNVADDFPVEVITEFLQDEERALLIGHTVAGTLLHLLADFIEEERLSEFLQNVIIDAVKSIDESPGTLILDFLAYFLENEDFAQYLASIMVDVEQAVNRETVEIYKQVVSRFFTQFIWRFL